MRNSSQTAFFALWVLLPCVSITTPAALAQTPQANKSQERIPPKLYPRSDWPSPVEDEVPRAYFLADVLEYRPGGDDSDFRWDAEGWYGGDISRLWFKSEGEQNTAFKAEYDIDAQLLYGRFVKRYYDFQVGGRVETHSFQGRNVTRALAVIGIEGLIPYRYDIESSLFISQNGDVSARFTFTRDFLITQHLALQPRIETNLAAQEVERFSTGRGLNNIEAGLRLRYIVRRELQPYIGVSYDRSFFRTAEFVRREGGDSNQIRFVAGVRFWH